MMIYIYIWYMYILNCLQILFQFLESFMIHIRNLVKWKPKLMITQMVKSSVLIHFLTMPPPNNSGCKSSIQQLLCAIHSS